MTRTNFFILIILGALFYVFVFPFLGETKASARVAQWQDKLTQELPAGTSRQKVARWSEDNKINFAEPTYGHKTAHVDEVKGLGIERISCPDWNIFIDITFDLFDKIATAEARKAGDCRDKAN